MNNYLFNALVANYNENYTLYKSVLYTKSKDIS